jgi:hypothetical protein
MDWFGSIWTWGCQIKQMLRIYNPWYWVVEMSIWICVACTSVVLLVGPEKRALLCLKQDVCTSASDRKCHVLSHRKSHGIPHRRSHGMRISFGQCEMGSPKAIWIIMVTPMGDPMGYSRKQYLALMGLRQHNYLKSICLHNSFQNKHICLQLLWTCLFFLIWHRLKRAHASFTKLIV